MKILDELERLEKEAICSPWAWRQFGGEDVLCCDSKDRRIVISGGYTRNQKGILEPMRYSQPVSDLIPAMRNNLKALIACARALEWYGTNNFANCRGLIADNGRRAREALKKLDGK